MFLGKEFFSHGGVGTKFLYGFGAIEYDGFEVLCSWISDALTPVDFLNMADCSLFTESLFEICACSISNLLAEDFFSLSGSVL